jgi:hypothetical protein
MKLFLIIKIKMSFEYLDARNAAFANVIDLTPTTTTTITDTTVTLGPSQLAGGILSFSLASVCTATLPYSEDLYSNLHPRRVGQIFKIYVCFTNTGATSKTANVSTGLGVTFATAEGDSYMTIVGTNSANSISHYILLQWNGIVSTNPTWTLYC